MDVFISKLRKMLAADEQVEIMNVHGKGFKLVVKES
jgi:DNA-binding response OmpR family regulator